jgi:hypothetical protein
MDEILKVIKAWEIYCNAVGELPKSVQDKLGFVTFAKERKRIETVLQAETELYEASQQRENHLLHIKESIKRYKSERDIATANDDIDETARLDAVIVALHDLIGGDK